MQFEIQRDVLASFREQLQQPRRFLQVVAGPRRVRRMGWMLFATGALAADHGARHEWPAAANLVRRPDMIEPASGSWAL